MISWTVRLEDDTDAAVAEAFAGNPYDAAAQAVEHFYDLGTWSGEEMPDAVVALVRERGAPVEMERAVRVVVGWSPTFVAVEMR